MSLTAAEKQKRYAERHPEKIRKANRHWRERNPEAYRTSVARGHERKRQAVREAKNQPCADCGGRFPPQVMDLHHRIPKDKSYSMATAIHKGEAALRAEIEKCVVLCANCHRERHWVHGTH